MSTAEIIEAISQLPKEEFRKVDEFMKNSRLTRLRDFFAWCDSRPRWVEMTEEEILALPRASKRRSGDEGSV